jgi:hypothetical protein
MDIANNALQNEFEIKSDMLSVAMDFLAMLNYFGFQHSWEIAEDYDLTIRDYQLQDLTAGVSINVEIGVRFDANKCQAVVEIQEFLLWADNQYFLIDNTSKLIHGQ